MKKKPTPARGRKVSPRASQTATPLVAESVQSGADRAFPIVGIGASAGGLEALEQFLKYVPPACGLAFGLFQSACLLYHRMATFSAAGVSTVSSPPG